MAETQQAGAVRGAHLVGGLKASDAESAMRTAGTILGRHLRSVTDGETGERSEWIGCQIGKLMAIDGIEMAGTMRQETANEDYSEWPALAVDPSVRELPSRSLGYADAAETSYRIFRRLRDEGALPADVRFQVSIPTPYATVVSFVRPGDRDHFFPVYARAIASEVNDIASVVEPDDLVIQYDVAVEIGVLSSAFTYGGDFGKKSFIIDALREICTVPEGGVVRGIHLCYGDYKHRHFTVPRDLSLCVDVANAVGDRAQFVHMPADRETGRDPRYYEPLRALVPGRRLALGVVDYEGDEQRTRELVEAAATGSGGMEFAVATECGMARIDQRHPGSPSLERLLELHAMVAAPLR